MEIQCLDVRGVKHETLKAIARVKIEQWGMILNDVKLFKKNQNTWVSLPNKMYESEGEKKYFPLVQFEDKKVEEDVKNSIRDSILKFMELGQQINEDNKTSSRDSFDGLTF
jgi:DNA-binding cell septation regulator SpoVG